MNLKNLLNLIFYFYFIINCGHGKKLNQVIGGTAASIYEFSFLVSIQWMNSHLCCGSIVSPLHIVTTASCVTFDKNIIYGNLKVLSGTKNQNYQLGHGNINDVEIVIIHSDYSPRQFWSNDISILKLTKPLIFSSTCTQVILPLPSPSHLYKRLRSIAWEKFDNEKFISKLNAKLLSRSDCSAVCKEFGKIHPAQECIKTEYESQKINNEDSGSPVITYQKSQLFGTVSLVFIKPYYNPAIITKIMIHYVDWILQIIINY